MNILESIASRMLSSELSALREAQTELRDNYRAASAQGAFLQERLLELEQDAIGWQQVGQSWELDFSRQGIQDIMRLSRLMYLKNPLVNRAVNLQALYVWGQGVEVECADETMDEWLEEFMERNDREVFGHQARTLKEIDLEVKGNLFLAFFSKFDDGSVTIRSIMPEEVMEIICDPEDARTPWFYKRMYSVQAFDYGSGQVTINTQTIYYPDYEYSKTATERPETIATYPVRWDIPVLHVKVGCLSDMKFGVPETYQALDWAKAYKSFLEDWATIVRSYARFAWQMSPGGGAKGIAAAKAKLSTTLSTTNVEHNPAPVTASVFLGTADKKLEPIRTAGATTSAEDGRRLLLMVAAATGMPESFFGDVSVGTLATAKSLDRPTELKFRDRQELWRDIWQRVISIAVERAKSAPAGLADDIDDGVTIKFPPILEHDVAAQVTGIVNAATLAGHPDANTIPREELSRMILSSLGATDIDEKIAQLQAEWATADAQQAAQAQVVQQTAMQQTAQQGTAQAQQQAAEALRETVGRFLEKYAAA